MPAKSPVARRTPKPRQARERLRKALAALENPAEYCKSEVGDSRYTNDSSAQIAFTMGAAKALIKYALHDLGEAIDPFKIT